MLSFLLILLSALSINDTLAASGLTRNLSDETRLEYSFYIAEAALEHSVDPLLISAVIYGESRFRNLRKNKTRDYGIMQVHWQHRPKTIPWLKELRRSDLYNIRTNINAGTWELATWRTICQKRGHKARQHKWWGHYQQGNKIKSHRYGRSINYKYQYLKRVLQKLRAKASPTS